ncbi:MAG: hypothetical protein IPP48_09280 [Chitinophagaceae bacterium]|nr:hypothetical protein [Chitinophagaceae bacterium]
MSGSWVETDEKFGIIVQWVLVQLWYNIDTTLVRNGFWTVVVFMPVTSTIYHNQHILITVPTF